MSLWEAHWLLSYCILGKGLIDWLPGRKEVRGRGWKQGCVMDACSSCKYLTPWKFQFIALEPEILWQRWFAPSFRKHFFFCYAIFTWIWTCKLHNLTDYQLAVGSFLQAIASMGRNKQSPRWPQFIQQLSLHSVPSSAGFIRLILLRSLLLDFPCATPAAPIAKTPWLSRLSSVEGYLWECEIHNYIATIESGLKESHSEKRIALGDWSEPAFFLKFPLIQSVQRNQILWNFYPSYA